MWHIWNDKLDGVDTRGTLNGLREGDGLQAYQKVYKRYSAVTGVSMSAKMSLAMHLDKPKKISEASSQLRTVDCISRSTWKHMGLLTR